MKIINNILNNYQVKSKLKIKLLNNVIFNNLFHSLGLLKKLTNPLSLLLLFGTIFLVNTACKDALGLDPNIKQTLLKEKENIVRDTIYLYPGSMNDSTYVVIIRYQNEKDSLQKIIDSLRRFYYPKLNPNVVNIDSNFFNETLFFKNLNGFEQKKSFNWNYNTELLNIRLDTLENWPVATINYNLTENLNHKVIFDKKEFFIKSFKLNTFRLGLLQVKELDKTNINSLNNYEIVLADNKGKLYTNPDFVGKVRIWFSDMNINRVDYKVIRHSFKINIEAIIAGKETKTIFRGSTNVNYY